MKEKRNSKRGDDIEKEKRKAVTGMPWMNE